MPSGRSLSFFTDFSRFLQPLPLTWPASFQSRGAFACWSTTIDQAFGADFRAQFLPCSAAQRTSGAAELDDEDAAVAELDEIGGTAEVITGITIIAVFAMIQRGVSMTSDSASCWRSGAHRISPASPSAYVPSSSEPRPSASRYVVIPHRRQQIVSPGLSENGASSAKAAPTCRR